MTKTTSAPLLALLATRQFFTVKLFTFTLSDGTISRYCSGDQDVVSGGNTFSCGGQTGPYFERGDNKAVVHWVIGTQVDSLSFDVLPGTGTIKGFNWYTAALYGIFDGATLLYQRAYLSAYPTVVGTYDMFGGLSADISLGRKMVTFTINSHMELLNHNVPLNFYQSSCNNNLYDTSCGVLPASYSNSGVVSAGSTAGSILAAMGPATAFFDLGKLTMTSGALNGFSIGIKSWTQGTPFGTFLLNRPFPAAPALGDTFTAYAGCDKQQTTCAFKFNNIANFRGTPYVPTPENAA